ncbi:OmpA family protein [Marinomonas fungiae]|uniref:OmpA family protein n=1 Tax=Marinomonas fungiae TaxID=1137284 RepID=UPI003A949210
MKKISYLTLLGVSLLSSSYVSANGNRVDVYCHHNGLEYQRSTFVGDAYRINLNQGGYSYVQEDLSIDPSFKFIQQELSAIGGVSPECSEFLMSKGTKIIANDGVMARVHFAFNSSELTEQSRYILDKLLERLKYSNNVYVEGHTDSVGEKQYNFTLGAERAVAVASYMAQHPNAPLNLVKVSKGETAPIADNSDADGRYLNRRVDIK